MIADRSGYLIEARVAGMEAYRQSRPEVILPLPGVGQAHTHAVIDKVKGTGYLPI